MKIIRGYFIFMKFLYAEHTFSMATNKHKPVDSKECLLIFTVLEFRNVKLVLLEKNVSIRSGLSQALEEYVSFPLLNSIHHLYPLARSIMFYL